MTWAQVLIVFLRAAFLSMNGSSTLAILKGDLVDRMHVLTPADFATGVVVGSASPGPLGYGCIALGFLADGWRGAIVATLTSWLPAFLAIPLRAWYGRLAHRPWVAGLNWGVAAAGSGLMVALSVGLAQQSAGSGWRASTLGVVILGLLFTRLPIVAILIIAALSGALFLR